MKIVQNPQPKSTGLGRLLIEIGRRTDWRPASRAEQVQLRRRLLLALPVIFGLIILIEVLARLGQ